MAIGLVTTLQTHYSYFLDRTSVPGTLWTLSMDSISPSNVSQVSTVASLWADRWTPEEYAAERDSGELEQNLVSSFKSELMASGIPGEPSRFSLDNHSLPCIRALTIPDQQVSEVNQTDFLPLTV